MKSSYKHPLVLFTATATIAALSYLAYSHFTSKNTSENKNSIENSKSNNSQQQLVAPKKSESEITDDLQEILKLPLIDLNKFFHRLKDTKEYLEECEKVAKALHKYGVIVVKDPRVHESDNDIFLDMMERYFAISDGIRDARPEHAYQVGVTPERTERPRDHKNVIDKLGPNDKPISSTVPSFDAKWRFFWRIGPQPPSTRFPSLNPEPVIPLEFPEWKDVMDMWGHKMLNALFTIAEMAAEGFHLPPDTFTSRMENGPHLLAPTASDFNKYGNAGIVLAGFHSDLNFLTIHGKSRYPGLSIWTREGKRMGVAVPDGCLLVQAGKQMEYLTGGYVHAGFHEVVVTDATVNTITKRKALGKSLWRISSTLFGHIQSDQLLTPLSPFDTSEAKVKFPPIYTGEFVRNELQAIALDRTGQ